MMKEAIILAGGFGTRLSSIVSEVPKPLAPVAGKPFLFWVLDELCDSGFSSAILAVGHRASLIQKAIGTHYRNLKVVFSVETTPLGTGGAIRQALHLATEPHVAILNGDSLFRISLQKLYLEHLEVGTSLSVALKRMDSCSRYGRVEIRHQKIINFLEKGFDGPGWINGGIYIAKRDFLLALLAFPEQFSFEDLVLRDPAFSEEIGGIPMNGYFIDIGVPEDYVRAQSELLF